VSTVLVRVTVFDADSAGGLIRQLVREVDAEDVCFEPDRQRVCVSVETRAEQTVGRILSVVESWLGRGGREPTSVEIDDHTYLLGAPTPAGGR
jgi:hypothetical protein